MGRVFLLIKNDVLLKLKSWNYVNEKKRRGLKIKRILIQFFFTFSIFDISGQSSCGSHWEQEAYIKSSNSDLDDNFGEVFSLDGDSIAVGVYLEDSNQTTITNGTTAASTDNSNTDSGAVYVFTRTFK